MGKSKRYNSEELSLMENLRRIGYSGRPTRNTIIKYSEEYKILIDQIEDVPPGEYPSQRALLLSHFRSAFANEIGSIKTYKLPSGYKFDDNKIEKAISLSCSRITKALQKKEKFRLYKPPWITKNFNLYIIFVLQEHSRLGNKFKIRPNKKDIRYIAALLIDKSKNLLKILNMSEKLRPLFVVLAQDELKIGLISPYDVEVVSWKSMTRSILSRQNKLEIEMISLNKTDFATGDKVIIEANKGDVKKYIEALLNQEDPQIISPDKFDISYIQSMKIRKPKGKTNFFEFVPLEDGSIIVKNRTRIKDKELMKLLAELGFKVGKILFDPIKIPYEKLLQQIIIRGYLPEKEAKIDRYKEILNDLKTKHLIKKIEERYLYRCTRSPNCWAGSAYTTKKCPLCGKTDRSKKFYKGLLITLDEKKLKEMIKTLMRKNEIKYRRLKASFYNNNYELQKISVPGIPEINIYFNTRGLYKDVLKDFKKCPRPLLSVNFRGEMKKPLEYIHQIDAASFINILFDKDSKKIVGFLKDVAKKPLLGEKREAAFKESLEELKKVKKEKILLQPRKGTMYEWLVSNIINYIFSISDKWGGPNLPDGIIGILPRDKRKFIFWDAKCYDDTRLSNYAKKRKKGIIKDVQYVVESLKQEDTYDEGQLAYYIFVTSYTHKEDFEKVKEKINEIIEKNKTILVKVKGKKRRKRKTNPLYKRLKEIRFCCLNIDELIELANVFLDKADRDKLIRNWEKFETAFEKLLILDGGYVSSERIKSEIIPLLKREEFVPKKGIHRRKGLTLNE